MRNCSTVEGLDQGCDLHDSFQVTCMIAFSDMHDSFHSILDVTWSSRYTYVYVNMGMCTDHFLFSPPCLVARKCKVTVESSPKHYILSSFYQSRKKEVLCSSWVRNSIERCLPSFLNAERRLDSERGENGLL